MSKKETWVISVGGGYGQFLFEGTEAEAEERRQQKAQWEGAVGRKRLATRAEKRHNIVAPQPTDCCYEDFVEWLAARNHEITGTPAPSEAAR